MPAWICDNRQTKNTCQCWRHGLNSWFGKILWSRKWQPTALFLPEKVHGQRSLSGFSPWGHKELDMTEWLSIHTHTHTYWVSQKIHLVMERLWKNPNFLADPIYYSQAWKLLGPGCGTEQALWRAVCVCGRGGSRGSVG